MEKSFKKWLLEGGGGGGGCGGGVGMAGTNAIVGNNKKHPDYQVWGAMSDLKAPKKIKYQSKK